MKLSQFDFELPQEKIATELMPEVNGHVQWRDECKLMVLFINYCYIMIFKKFCCNQAPEFSCTVYYNIHAKKYTSNF